MKKVELVSKIAEDANLTKAQTEALLKSFTKVVQEALVAGDKVAINGLGTFEVRERAARKGINPATKEQIEIPASKAPAFKTSSTLKNLVKNA